MTRVNGGLISGQRGAHTVGKPDAAPVEQDEPPDTKPGTSTMSSGPSPMT